MASDNVNIYAITAIIPVSFSALTLWIRHGVLIPCM